MEKRLYISLSRIIRNLWHKKIAILASIFIFAGVLLGGHYLEPNFSKTTNNELYSELFFDGNGVYYFDSSMLHTMRTLSTGDLILKELSKKHDIPVTELEDMLTAEIEPGTTVLKLTIATNKDINTEALLDEWTNLVIDQTKDLSEKTTVKQLSVGEHTNVVEGRKFFSRRMMILLMVAFVGFLLVALTFYDFFFGKVVSKQDLKDLGLTEITDV